jgi:hypothetical protein
MLGRRRKPRRDDIKSLAAKLRLMRPKHIKGLPGFCKTAPPPRTDVTVTPTSGLERAQVKWFNRFERSLSPLLWC